MCCKRRRIRSSYIAFLVLLLEVILISSSSAINDTSSDQSLCRDRMSYLDIETFRLTTCASCYSYLFTHDNPPKELIASSIWLVKPNGTDFIEYPADIHAYEYRTEICDSLSKDECSRWILCCSDAEKCCNRQMETSSPLHPENSFCPQTWDGWGCWDYTVAGKIAHGLCPEFINFAIPSERSVKECTSNGTWYQHSQTHLEWTDYSNCINLHNLKMSTITSIVCNAISFLALFPSVAIFLYYRPLRIQHRVRLHMNLFLSFIFYSIVHILWDVLIVLDRMDNPASITNINRSTLWCKTLYVLTRYSRMTNFFWMFCEAVYLHRLLVKAFQPPKRIIAFYVAGWAFPWLPVLAYIVLRALYANTNCWVKPYGNWEWLIYVPNLLALLMNLIVLFDILRIILLQTQTCSNELDNFRRALKAVLILVPLFGLQLFLVIYRPPYQSTFGRHYEMIAAFVVNLQGFCVALIFCLANGEVASHLRRSWQRLQIKVGLRGVGRNGSMMVTNQSELYSLTRRNSAVPTTTINTNSRRQVFIPLTDLNVVSITDVIDPSQNDGNLILPSNDNGIPVTIDSLKYTENGVISVKEDADDDDDD